MEISRNGSRHSAELLEKARADTDKKTVPLETIDAYRDHGDPKLRLEQGVDEANCIMVRLPELGVDIDKVTQALEDDGIKKFVEPFDKLMEALTKKSSQ